MVQFDNEIITLTTNERLMDILRISFEKKGLSKRMDGIFIIDEVTIKSINDEKVVCIVEYEYE